MNKKILITCCILFMIVIAIVLTIRTQDKESINHGNLNIEEMSEKDFKHNDDLKVNTQTQQKTTDGEDNSLKLDKISQSFQELFGEDYAPRHYTKKGLNSELGITIPLDTDILDFRNANNSVVFIGFYADNSNSKNIIENALDDYNKEKMNSNGYIYSKDAFLFYICTEDNNKETIIDMINSIIKAEE